MQILTNPQELREQCRAWAREGEDISLVPTMGYYHAGHESLMKRGRSLAKRMIVSLFVNPTQFGPGEDLESYPRNFEGDAAIAEAQGADVLFAPEASSMFYADHGSWVEVPDLAKGLCGAARPTHFRGVCTVVLKLFLLTGANYAVFGQKDWQQQAIIKRMVRDLDVDIRIVSQPTVREADGLAMSSRNVYLSAEERCQAPLIRSGLLAAQKMALAGEKNVGVLKDKVLSFWAENLPLGRLDYLSVAHPDSLEPLENIDGAALMACAVKLGKARLIDNILLAE